MTHGTPITRREFTKRTAALAAAPLLPRDLSWPAGGAWPGYADATVIDCLASPGPFNVQNRIGEPLSDEMIANVRASGITAVNVTVSGGGPGHQAFDSTFTHLAYWEREVADHPDVLMKARTVADVDRAKETGRLGLILGFQDAAMLEGDLSRLGLFHDFGIRIIQLTYNLRNQLGDGCLEPGNSGLSRFGHAVVEVMNERGILVDLSHCGTRTTADAIAASSRPAAITHSGCRAIYDHPRSKRDDELRALAERGGVLGVYLMPFLNAEGPPRTQHLIAHIEHAVQVCGEDHVGIGSDLSITPTEANDEYRRALAEFADERQRLGIGAPREHELLFVPELNSPRRMEMIADALSARGHGHARIEKILGGNFRRLFQDVWAA